MKTTNFMVSRFNGMLRRCPHTDGAHTNICYTAALANKLPADATDAVKSENDTSDQRVEQLRLFALDGVLSEPYVPGRARRRAKAAVGGGGNAP